MGRDYDARAAYANASAGAGIGATRPRADGEVAIAAGVEMQVSRRIGDHGASGIRAQPRHHGAALARIRHEVDGLAVTVLRRLAGSGNDRTGPAGRDHPYGSEARLETGQDLTGLRGETGARGARAVRLRCGGKQCGGEKEGERRYDTH